MRFITVHLVNEGEIPVLLRVKNIKEIKDLGTHSNITYKLNRGRTESFNIVESVEEVKLQIDKERVI